MNCQQKQYIMKTIYTVTTQHDGLMNVCFTNIKAMYNFLTTELNVNERQSTIDIMDKDYKNTTYSLGYQKLVYVVRQNQNLKRSCVASIETEIGTITIDELTISSK